MGEHLQLDIVGHPKTPCIHQDRSPVSSSKPSPRLKTQYRAPGFILDAVIVADRPYLGVSPPPLAVHALGAVAGTIL